MIANLRQSTWAIPALLALATLTGLLLALVAEGVWDWLAWVLVALPVGVVVRFVYMRK
ncbi:MAG: hypothetical protein IAE77_13185 [Prosthecobacter sp.]|jgi:hypothetical protein|uniref:hypothetical protein n=1 Tax=Prosthecobacter sp. TaxID=1965333 RepID=UPI0019F4A34C|nr:hypothetical protein [Prosthecobacter sp.]MBE2284404.1 hypothetical protein [Prosthecobacter sp.]